MSTAKTPAHDKTGKTSTQQFCKDAKSKNTPNLPVGEILIKAGG